MIASILRDLQQPEYLHVLLNPMPVYGLAGGLIGLFIALWQRSRNAIIASLVIVLISSASALPVFMLGTRSYDRVLTMSDDVGRAWLADHAQRAQHLVWFFYAAAVLSIAGLITPRKWPRTSVPLAIAVLLLGVTCLGMGGYIAYAGGRIRHREFRLEQPPNRPAARAAEQPTPAMSPSSPAAPAAARVTIQMSKYSPDRIEIKAGQTVEWINNDVAPHTVTAQDNNAFDSGTIEPDASWSHTFSEPGTFPYYCTFHPEMKGIVEVK